MLDLQNMTGEELLLSRIRYGDSIKPPLDEELDRRATLGDRPASRRGRRRREDDSKTDLLVA
jgi:hypothetical protein